ncbi:MAG: hypothetical protein ACTS7E_00445 [Arsenophonus sp. NC-CH8-MAG3]
MNDLSDMPNLYFLPDDIYSNVRKVDYLYLLFIIGNAKHGYKKLLGLKMVYQELKAHWSKLLNCLRVRYLTVFSEFLRETVALVWKCNSKDIPECAARMLFGA